MLSKKALSSRIASSNASALSSAIIRSFSLYWDNIWTVAGVMSPWLRISAADGSVDTGLYETILRLPVKQREVVLLYFYQNMTMQEVSDILQISVSNVSRRLESARKALRKQLEEDERHE